MYEYQPLQGVDFGDISQKIAKYARQGWRMASLQVCSCVWYAMMERRA